MIKRRVSLGLAAVAVVIAASFVIWRWESDQAGERVAAGPTRSEPGEDETVRLTMDQLLDMAADARRHVVETVDDYTATFIQQERDDDGVLGPETVMEMKVRTRHRGGEEGSPMRVYLHFLSPESAAGREVIWAEDLYSGKLVVHEAGALGLLRLHLDPEGLIAMRGQRHPISEIGLTKLIDKLIERGEFDRGSTDLEVTLSEGHQLGETPVSLIRIRRPTPAEGENNFSIAEIAFDPRRQLILSYRSFGWPEEPGGEPTLLESYTYRDVRTNVGLSEQDFDPDNPEYDYP